MEMGHYVYGVPGREDGLQYAVHSYDNPRQIAAAFHQADDCQAFIDALRARGGEVHVLPTAEGSVR
jgi:hypothetical protein